MKSATTLNIHFWLIFLEALSAYVIQLMPCDESFYPECPPRPVSAHIFSMQSQQTAKSVGTILYLVKSKNKIIFLLLVKC